MSLKTFITHRLLKITKFNRFLSSMVNVKTTEQKLKVGNFHINYVLSRCDGHNTDKTLIMLPGALGNLKFQKI